MNKKIRTLVEGVASTSSPLPEKASEMRPSGEQPTDEPAEIHAHGHRDHR